MDGDSNEPREPQSSALSAAETTASCPQQFPSSPTADASSPEVRQHAQQLVQQDGDMQCVPGRDDVSKTYFEVMNEGTVASGGNGTSCSAVGVSVALEATVVANDEGGEDGEVNDLRETQSDSASAGHAQESIAGRHFGSLGSPKATEALPSTPLLVLAPELSADTTIRVIPGSSPLSKDDHQGWGIVGDTPRNTRDQVHDTMPPDAALSLQLDASSRSSKTKTTSCITRLSSGRVVPEDTASRRGAEHMDIMQPPEEMLSEAVRVSSEEQELKGRGGRLSPLAPLFSVGNNAAASTSDSTRMRQETCCSGCRDASPAAALVESITQGTASLQASRDNNLRIPRENPEQSSSRQTDGAKSAPQASAANDTGMAQTALVNVNASHRLQATGPERPPGNGQEVLFQQGYYAVQGSHVPPLTHAAPPGMVIATTMGPRYYEVISPGFNQVPFAPPEPLMAVGGIGVKVSTHRGAYYGQDQHQREQYDQHHNRVTEVLSLEDHDSARSPVEVVLAAPNSQAREHFGESRHGVEDASRSRTLHQSASITDGLVEPRSSERTNAHTIEARDPGMGQSESDAKQNNAYNDIGLVVTRTKELEKILRELFGASGNGLNEQLSSLRFDGRIDRRTQQQIRSIAAMRNKLVHSVDANKLSISNTFGAQARRALKRMVDDLETTLRGCADKAVQREAVEHAARPIDSFKLSNHPAFRGLVHAGAHGGHNSNTAAVGSASTRAAGETIVVKDNARFPHNLITAKTTLQRARSADVHAPNIADEVAFPDIAFAAAALRRKRRGVTGSATSAGEGEAREACGDDAKYEGGILPAAASTTTDAQVHADVNAGGGWDGQGRIEDAEVVSGRGVCRKLVQAQPGYMPNKYTMSGVYRMWDGTMRNPRVPVAFRTTQDVKEAPKNVPGASPSHGQVAFEARGLDLATKAPKTKRAHHARQARQTQQGRRQAHLARLGATAKAEEAWEEAPGARRKRGLKDDRGARSYVVRRSPAAPFWLLPRAVFGRSNCRGWFPTCQDWYARGMPECVYVPLEPSSEDRVEAMRYGHTPVVGLTLEEDEERLMRIAMRESAEESKRAYEKKYGTEAEREARRDAQAKARAKAMAERESLEREQEEQLKEVIKASLAEALGPGERDDLDVIAAIEASKRAHDEAALDPDTVRAMAESRRQHETRQEMMRIQGMTGVSSTSSSTKENSRPQGRFEGDRDSLSFQYANDHMQEKENNRTPYVAEATAQEVVVPPSVPPSERGAPLHGGHSQLASSTFRGQASEEAKTTGFVVPEHAQHRGPAHSDLRRYGWTRMESTTNPVCGRAPPPPPPADPNRSFTNSPSIVGMTSRGIRETSRAEPLQAPCDNAYRLSGTADAALGSASRLGRSSSGAQHELPTQPGMISPQIVTKIVETPPLTEAEAGMLGFVNADYDASEGAQAGTRTMHPQQHKAAHGGPATSSGSTGIASVYDTTRATAYAVGKAACSAPPPQAARTVSVEQSPAEWVCRNSVPFASGETGAQKQEESLGTPLASKVDEMAVKGTADVDEHGLLAAVLEASRQDEAVRQQEERDAKAVIDRALELSIQDAGPIHRYEHFGGSRRRAPQERSTPAPPLQVVNEDCVLDSSTTTVPSTDLAGPSVKDGSYVVQTTEELDSQEPGVGAQQSQASWRHAGTANAGKEIDSGEADALPAINADHVHGGKDLDTASVRGRHIHESGGQRAGTEAVAGATPGAFLDHRPSDAHGKDATARVKFRVLEDEAGEGRGGGGDEVDDELARVLEESRLEELNRLRVVSASISQEEDEMMARVMEASRKEQDERNSEQLELEQALQASLRT